MAYIKHDKEWWDKEADWIEAEAAKPADKRMCLFGTYCRDQLKHCRANGTSWEAECKILRAMDAAGITVLP